MTGEKIRARVFRDTVAWYPSMPEDAAAQQLLSFVKKHAGTSILDLGCATGNYSVDLNNTGYSVIVADGNHTYVHRAHDRGIETVLLNKNVPLRDKSVDTVICFDVIEHVSDGAGLLSEAKRLARKNVRLTTPNSEHADELMRQGLLFEHFAELDHINFFTQESLTHELNKQFSHVTVTKEDGINPTVRSCSSVFIRESNDKSRNQPDPVSFSSLCRNAALAR